MNCEACDYESIRGFQACAECYAARELGRELPKLIDDGKDCWYTIEINHMRTGDQWIVALRDRRNYEEKRYVGNTLWETIRSAVEGENK